MSDPSIAKGETFLAHHGVLGMHWGKRKSGSAKDIYAARARISNRKAKIKGHEGDTSVYASTKVADLKKANKKDAPLANAFANKKEKATSGLGKATVATLLAAYGAAKISEVAGSHEAKAGAATISLLLTGVGSGLGVATIATAASANKTERQHYRSTGE